MKTNSIHTKISAVLMGVGVLVASTSAVDATVLVDTNFTGNTWPGASGWYSYNTSYQGSPWITNSTPSGADPSLFSGTTMQNNAGAAANSEVFHSFDETTLSSVGDSITFTTSVYFNSASGSVAFQMEFLNLENPLTGNRMGGTDPSLNEPSYFFRQYWNNTTSDAITYAHRADGSTIDSSSMAPAISLSQGSHSVTYSLTIVNGGVLAESYIDGTLSSSYKYTTITGPIVMNSVSMSSPGVNSSVYFDNILVSTSVPEASEVAIALGMVALGLALLRRRERHV